MEAYADPSVNRLTIQCSAQSAKTLTVLVLVCWTICENPGNLLWVTRNDEEAKKIAKMRLWPMLESCAPVARKLPTAKTAKLTKEIYLPGSYIAVAGATNKGALQSTPFRYVFGDESRSWPKGALEMVTKRVRSFGHRYKFVLLSTPDAEDDTMDRAYQSGTQEIWKSSCRNCQESFDLNWDNLKFDEKKDEDLNWLYDEIETSIRIECPACGEKYFDTPLDRKYLSSNGEWVVTNPTAPKNEVSLHWCGLLPYWANLKDQVIEFLKAKDALSLGETAPLKDHINETRGLPWSTDFAHKDTGEKLENLTLDYDPILDAVPWESEDPDGKDKSWRRFMGVDVQAKGGMHFYYEVRACGPNGQSRLLDYGRDLLSFHDVADKAEEWKVPANNVVMDCAYGTAQVYGASRDHGFTPFRGVKRESFNIGGGVKSIFQWTLVDPEIGTAGQGKNLIRVLQIAKPAVLTMLDLHLHGEAGEWRMFQGTARWYQTGLTAYERRKKVNKSTGVAQWEWFDRTRGANDHSADCACAILAACKATDLL